MNVEGEDLPALGMTAICLNCGISLVSRGGKPDLVCDIRAVD